MIPNCLFWGMLMCKLTFDTYDSSHIKGSWNPTFMLLWLWIADS